MLSDNGKYVLIVGPRYTTRKSFVLERSGSTFITHDIDMTGGITELTGVRRQYDYVSTSDPLNHQIARNGNMVSGVKVGGVFKSAVWSNGFNNPPYIHDLPNYYRFISDSGEKTLGFTSSNIPVIVDLGTFGVDLVTGSTYIPQCGNYCMDKIVGWSSVDPNERAVIFEKISGSWIEEPSAYIVAHVLASNVDFPTVTGMSGDGTKICGMDSYGYDVPLYWDLTQPPTGGYRQAVVLPSADDTSSYGPGGYCEGISSDGSVIYGYTQYGYPCFWTISNNFSKCYILQNYLVGNTDGPSTASLYDGNVYSSGSYNTFGKMQVSHAGRHVISIASKQGTDDESLLYSSPINPLSNPGYYFTDDNFSSVETGSSFLFVSGSAYWTHPTYIGYWGNEYGYDSFSSYNIGTISVLSSKQTWPSDSGGIGQINNMPIIENFSSQQTGSYDSSINNYKISPWQA